MRFAVGIAVVASLVSACAPSEEPSKAPSDSAFVGDAGDAVDLAMAFLATVLKLFGRIVAFPMATCAACNGHVFAGGAMLALAHDWRVMREDRGFFCLPELDLGMPLPVGMRSLIKEKMDPQVFRDSILTAARYAANDCARLGIVDESAAEADVLPISIERMRPLAGKSRDAFKALKRGMYAELLEDLCGPRAVDIPK